MTLRTGDETHADSIRELAGKLDISSEELNEYESPYEAVIEILDKRDAEYVHVSGGWMDPHIVIRLTPNN